MPSDKTVTRAAMLVEVDGKAYFVALPQERMMILVNLATSLSDNGTLTVMPAPQEIEFRTVAK